MLFAVAVALLLLLFLVLCCPRGEVTLLRGLSALAMARLQLDVALVVTPCREAVQNLSSPVLAV